MGIRGDTVDLHQWRHRRRVARGECVFRDVPRLKGEYDSTDDGDRRENGPESSPVRFWWWNRFVPGDDATLVEPLENELLRASYGLGENGPALLAAHFDSPNVRHRVLALRGLVRQSLVDADLWLRALSDEHVEIRREALQQFAHAPLEDDAVLDEVVRRLRDSDDLVVEGAAFALGEHLWANAVDELCDVATNHDDARCRESAVAALGAIGDDRARATIINALKDKPAVRRRAIVALSNFEGPDVETALDQAGDDRDWQVRSAVTQLRNTER